MTFRMFRFSTGTAASSSLHRYKKKKKRSECYAFMGSLWMHNRRAEAEEGDPLSVFIAVKVDSVFCHTDHLTDSDPHSNTNH